MPKGVYHQTHTTYTLQNEQGVASIIIEISRGDSPTDKPTTYLGIKIMSDQDLIVEIENSFRYMRFIDCTIETPTTKSYTPVRNKNGGYNLDLRVSAAGDVIDYTSDDFNVWAAKVQYLVRLTDCTYSNETGLNWDSETGSCEIIHNAFSPNVITFSDDQCRQNNADLPNYRYTGGIELADDITLGHFLSERMFYSSRLSERSEMISKVVNGIKIDSCFAKRYQNNLLTA